MPLYKDFSGANARILFWKFSEGDRFIHEELILPEDSVKIQNYHPKKLLEYLMVRQMLKIALPQHKILYKAIGQPYLEPRTAFVSITHSFPFAALAVSEKRVGVDLEKVMPKIRKIKHKFLHRNEVSWTENEDEIEFLTIIWVIKEALYKLHPSKLWSLKNHYEVLPFRLNALSALRCRVFSEDFEDYYTASIVKIEGFYFSFIEEDHAICYDIPKGEKRKSF